MDHLTQSVSINDVYKLNISYQCIKRWYRRDLRWDPSRPYLYNSAYFSLCYVVWITASACVQSFHYAWLLTDMYSSSWLDIFALRSRTLCYCYWLNNNGTLERLSFRFYCWVRLGWVGTLVGWVGFKKMDPRPTMAQFIIHFSLSLDMKQISFIKLLFCSNTN